MRHCGWLLGLLSLFSLATHASDWQEIKNEAKGQTVWFNAWGGDTAINRYLDWVSGEMKTHYAEDCPSGGCRRRGEAHSDRSRSRT